LALSKFVHQNTQSIKGDMYNITRFTPDSASAELKN